MVSLLFCRVLWQMLSSATIIFGYNKTVLRPRSRVVHGSIFWNPIQSNPSICWPNPIQSTTNNVFLTQIQSNPSQQIDYSEMSSTVIDVLSKSDKSIINSIITLKQSCHTQIFTACLCRISVNNINNNNNNNNNIQSFTKWFLQSDFICFESKQIN